MGRFDLVIETLQKIKVWKAKNIYKAMVKFIEKVNKKRRKL